MPWKGHAVDVFAIPRAGTWEVRACYGPAYVFGQVQDGSCHAPECTYAVSLLVPLPVGDVSKMKAAAEALALDDFCASHFAILDDVEVWTMLTVLGLNGLAGFGRATGQGRPSEPQRRALECLRQSTSRVLSPTLRLDRTAEEAEKELAGRFVTYTGEEVPKMQTIRFDAAVAALPPQSHGGSIDVLKLVSDGTRSFLENPEKSLLSQPKMGVKLQAKVHIKPEEALAFCQELVSRNICTWVSHDAVLRVNGECVLNGMFAVGKNTYLDSGFEVQRTIMNLIPSNSCFRQAEGATHELPSICQYLSLVLDGSSKLAFFQSDMSSAFYLFRIPKKWSRMLSFNIDFDGECLGLKKGVRYHPACSVIPMGWHSAVSIMQEVADKLTALGQLPKENMVRRNIPLPPWLTDVLTEGSQKQKPWYHVYLDNFCAMQRTADRGEPEEAHVLHEELEQAWNDAGVLSSAKKRVSGAIKVDELGARLEGEAGTIGPSPERLLKLLQTTLVIISKTRLRRKWVQVVAGRWVHCMSFRRPTMVLLDRTWQYISEQSNGPNVEAWVRTELFGCCMVALMMHTNLRAVISETTTASDASSTGGAVGKSTELSSCGTEFAAMDASGLGTGKVIPVLVLSLFNGIGCCFRTYDLCGVLPQVAIAYELSGPANRVTSRRWPHVQIEKDVRDINEETIRQWRYRYPGLEELHLWGGFPCVDLSRVKAGRMNLEGAESGLFYEIPRILKEIRKVFGYHFKVRYCVENVASMDEAAEAEISRALGVKPFLLDPWGVVPLHRPRYCWSNTEIVPMEGVWLEEKDRWVEVNISHTYPSLDQWLEPGAVWPGYNSGATLPTCMKCIKRSKPPPRPAGINRVDMNGKLRWEADNFKFPPYQYHEKFIIWVGEKWRLISAQERELLHGLGYNHTVLCMNANDIKRSPQEFEDLRKTLIGDSFSCYSFSYMAAMLCNKWVSIPDYTILFNRMGMAPGYNCDINVRIPLQRGLSYGATDLKLPISALHASLLRRVNHTGSDVRISSGAVLNPRAFPRQSAAADWWVWQKVFGYRWSKGEHINSLELRSIIHSVEWRIRHLKEVHARIFHLTDSYICMSIISKGRSSSKMLKPLLRRLTSELLAWDIYLIISHVESSENPTDNASRAWVLARTCESGW